MNTISNNSVGASEPTERAIASVIVVLVVEKHQ